MLQLHFLLYFLDVYFASFFCFTTWQTMRTKMYENYEAIVWMETQFQRWKYSLLCYGTRTRNHEKHLFDGSQECFRFCFCLNLFGSCVMKNGDDWNGEELLYNRFQKLNFKGDNGRVLLFQRIIGRHKKNDLNKWIIVCRPKRQPLNFVSTLRLT